MKNKKRKGKSRAIELAPEIIKGLKLRDVYLGFLIKQNTLFIGLANLNLNYSIWKARFVNNVHDFIAHSKSRNWGISTFLLQEPEDYSIQNI